MKEILEYFFFFESYEGWTSVKLEFVVLLWNMLSYCKGHCCLHILYYCDLYSDFSEKYFFCGSFLTV
jgi:hypothetical protein